MNYRRTSDFINCSRRIDRFEDKPHAASLTLKDAVVVGPVGRDRARARAVPIPISPSPIVASDRPASAARRKFIRRFNAALFLGHGRQNQILDIFRRALDIAIGQNGVVKQ